MTKHPKLGHFLMIHNAADAAKAQAYLVREQLRLKGIPMSIALDEALERQAKVWETYLLLDERSYGVPAALAQLLAASSKAEAKRLADDLLLTGKDFAHLVANCDLLGFTPEFKRREHVPEHVRCLPRGPKTALKGFQERKVVTSHMLTKRAEWHCFYFSDSEAFDETHLGKPPHWKTTHVHYISHRWGRQVRKEDVWRDLDRRSFGGRGAAHIKFEQTRP